MITADELKPGHYIAELPEPLDNPNTDRRYRDLWTAAETFPADRLYVLHVRHDTSLFGRLEDEGVEVCAVELGRFGQYSHHHLHALLFVRNGERQLKPSLGNEGAMGPLMERLRIVEPTLREKVKLLERFEYITPRDIVYTLIESGILDDKTLSVCVTAVRAKHERELAQEELERERTKRGR